VPESVARCATYVTLLIPVVSAGSRGLSRTAQQVASGCWLLLHRQLNIVGTFFRGIAAFVGSLQLAFRLMPELIFLTLGLSVLLPKEAHAGRRRICSSVDFFILNPQSLSAAPPRARGVSGGAALARA